MLDEITIDGQQFIAARRAAAIVAVSPDYLTRWCREGLVEAKRLAGGIFHPRSSRSISSPHLPRTLTSLSPPGANASPFFSHRSASEQLLCSPTLRVGFHAYSCLGTLRGVQPPRRAGNSVTATPNIEITYCRLCGWGLRAGWMAQELLSTFADELGSVTLTPDTTGGVFEVRVDGATVWSRKEAGRFPEITELKRLVRDRIAPGRPLGHVDTT
jgi:selenoprotein W-related protein